LEDRLNTGKLDPDVKEYLEKMNEEFSLIVNIESVPALDILPDLINIKELDGVLIGPHDLTISMGIPEQYEHPKYLKAVDTIIKEACKVNMGVGIHSWTSIEQDKKWIDSGLNFLIHASDFLAAKTKLREDLIELRQ
jgi:4-hydroxy-2-oxoheptanedioate aldolase